MPRILLVEDAPADARRMASVCLRVAPDAVIDTVATSREALPRLEANAYDLAVVDIVLRGSKWSGIEVGRIARVLGVPVVYVSGHPGLVPLDATSAPKGDDAALETAVRKALGYA